MSLREQIDRRLASNQVYYAHFVKDRDMVRIREYTTNDILNMVKKTIDSVVNSYPRYAELDDLKKELEDKLK